MTTGRETKNLQAPVALPFQGYSEKMLLGETLVVDRGSV